MEEKENVKTQQYLGNNRSSFEIKLREEFIPPYIQIFRKIKKITSVPISIQATIIIGVISLLTWWLTKVTGTITYLPDFWLFFISSISIVIFGLLFMRYVWCKHIQVFGDLLSILSNQKQIDDLKKVFILMYKSKSQLWSFLSFSVLGAIIVFFLYPPLPFVSKVYNSILIGFPCAGVAGLGACLSLTSSIFIYKLTKFNNLKLNPLNPGQTVGIAQLSKLMSLYATLFTIENTLWLIPFVYLSLTAQTRIPPLNLDSLSYQSAFALIIIFFCITVPIYFLYPQLALRRIIIREKNGLLQKIEGYIKELCFKTDYPLEKDIPLIEKYGEIFNRIQRSKTMPIDVFSGFRFIGSLAFSLFLIIISKPTLLTDMMDVFQKLRDLFK
ncbi:MAG: hypothetical protein QME42_00860 [bacterium]|nr:hypothetical protein [bacterium]